MRITISGSPGSGTTSLGKALAERYNLRYLSAGEVFRGLAKEHGMDLAAFGKLAEENPEIDLKIDARQKEIGEASDDIILEGRLAGWMVENADLKILLYASPDCRAERLSPSLVGCLGRCPGKQSPSLGTASFTDGCRLSVGG